MCSTSQTTTIPHFTTHLLPPQGLCIEFYSVSVSSQVIFLVFPVFVRPIRIQGGIAPVILLFSLKNTKEIQLKEESEIFLVLESQTKINFFLHLASFSFYPQDLPINT